MPGPPAFQFYPADFIMGTLTLSNACVGAYIRLLCYQWDAGGIPASIATVASIIREPRRKVVITIWNALKSKFDLGHDGLYRNRRLEDVRRNLQTYLDMQAANGRKGGLAKARAHPSDATFSLVANRWRKASSSIFDLQSSVQKERGAAPPISPPVEKAVEKPGKPKPNVPVLAAMIRAEGLLGIPDESEAIQAATFRAAQLHLAYTGSAIRRALASARAQQTKAPPATGFTAVGDVLPPEVATRLQALKAQFGTPAPSPNGRRRRTRVED